MTRWAYSALRIKRMVNDMKKLFLICFSVMTVLSMLLFGFTGIVAEDTIPVDTSGFTASESVADTDADMPNGDIVIMDGEGGLTAGGVSKEEMGAILQFLKDTDPEKFEKAERYFEAMEAALRDANAVKIADWMQNKRAVILIIIVMVLMLSSSLILLGVTRSTNKKTKTITSNAITVHETVQESIKESLGKVQKATDENKDSLMALEKYFEQVMKNVFAESKKSREAQIVEMKEIVSQNVSDRSDLLRELARNNELMTVLLDLHRVELSQMAISTRAKDEAEELVTRAKGLVNVDEGQTSV